MYIFEATIKATPENKDVLVIFSGQNEGDSLDYSHFFEEQLEEIKARPEELFFICPSYLDNEVSGLFSENSKPREGLVRFGEDIPVTLLSFDMKGLSPKKTILGESSCL